MTSLKASALLLGSLGTSAALLTGCGQSSAAPSSVPNHDKTVTISFMQRESTSTLKPYLVHLTNQFMKSHPHIKVNLIFEPDSTTLHTEEEAAVAANNAPTLGQVGGGWAEAYAASDAIIPLTSFIHGKNGLTQQQISDIWPGMYQEAKLSDGKVWMWPFNQSVWVMYYNKQLVQQLHLTIPKTWPQFLSVAKEIHAPNVWALSIDPNDMGEDLALIMAEAYGSPIIKNGQPNFDTPGAKDALALMQKLYASGEMKIGSDYPGNVAFGSGHAVFHITTTDGYYYDLKAAEGKFTMQTAPIPTGPQGGAGNMLGGDNLVIFSQASPAQRAAAWTYMKWLTEPQQTAYWATHTGYLPVTKTAVPLMQNYLATHQYKQVGMKELGTAPPEPEVTDFTEGADDFGDALQKVLINQASIAESLSVAEQQAKQAMSAKN